MKTKNLALIAFCVPFLLGGGFQSLGVALDLLAKPDRSDMQIIQAALETWLYCGTILGSIGLVAGFAIFGISVLSKKCFSKNSNK